MTNWPVAIKVVVLFGVFGKIGAMVLLISLEKIELEGCACAQIKAPEEWKYYVNPDEAWYLSKRDRNAANAS